MRLLDLFAGAGGASWGYHLAGFDDITGVDIEPQKHYPFKFIQADAMEFPLDGYDLIHASPPCQKYSATNVLNDNEHPDLIPLIRDRLTDHDCDYVIENVVGAPLRWPITLCGRMFGLMFYEHRLFEANFHLGQLKHPEHTFRTTKMGRPPKDDECMQFTGHFAGAEEGRKRMGTPWMTRNEMSQAIPPVYAEYVGLGWRFR